jgi:hypothetical protein
MPVLHATGVAKSSAALIASTISAGGTVLGVSFAGLSASAMSYENDLVVIGPAQTLARLRDAYESSRGPGAAEINIELRVPSWSSIGHEERRLALIGKMLIP